MSILAVNTNVETSGCTNVLFMFRSSFYVAPFSFIIWRSTRYLAVSVNKIMNSSTEPYIFSCGNFRIRSLWNVKFWIFFWVVMLYLVISGCDLKAPHVPCFIDPQINKVITSLSSPVLFWTFIFLQKLLWLKGGKVKGDSPRRLKTKSTQNVVAAKFSVFASHCACAAPFVAHSLKRFRSL